MYDERGNSKIAWADLYNELLDGHRNYRITFDNVEKLKEKKTEKSKHIRFIWMDLWVLLDVRNK